MKLTKTQYKKLEKLIVTAMKTAKISNYKFMYAMLYIIKNGCKRRTLLKKYEKRHVVYAKFNK